MKHRSLFLLLLCAAVTEWATAQDDAIPANYAVDDSLSASLTVVIRGLGLDGPFDTGEDGMEQISLAVVDLTGDVPRFGGVNPTNFIYPASVYKMYVAAEVLHQVSSGD